MKQSQKGSLTPTAEEQLGIACYVSRQKIAQTRKWTQQENAPGGMGSPCRNQEDVLSLDMNISQAPPSFRQPVTQKKAFYPPFKIQMSVCFGPDGTQLPLKVNAYSLTEDALVSFLKQVSHGSFPALPTESGLMNACIYKCIENRQGGDDPECSVVKETFEFADMHFKSSSRMGLRWLLFAARVQDDLLCILYKHPTIVLSRKTDQYCKACSILSKANPIAEFTTDRSSGTSSPTRRQSSSSHNKLSHQQLAPPKSPQTVVPTDAKEWILAAYGECRFHRSLVAHDLAYLEAKLGLTGCSMQQMVSDSWTGSTMEDDRRRFDSFAKWYLACLLSLKREGKLWCADDVMRICPFAVDRTLAERVLKWQPIGTFLIRISSEPGCFVLSIKVMSYDGEYIEHFLIDSVDLKEQNLSSWVLSNQQAHIFLDINTGVKYPKQVIFIERISYQLPNFIVSHKQDHSSSSIFNNNKNSSIITTSVAAADRGFLLDGCPPLLSKDFYNRSTDSESYTFECA